MRATRRTIVSGMMGAMLMPGGERKTEAETEPPAGAPHWPTLNSTARPWTRWWWHGNAVDQQNLTRQMEAFKAAGLGGVEITSIYGVKGQDAREIPYLSAHWAEMLTHVCTEAKRLGMEVDLPPGSGWRIGGPGLSPALASADVVIETHDSAGGKPFHLDFPKRPQAVVAYGADDAIVPLTAKIDAQGHLDWTPPPGEWTLYVVSQKYNGSKVKRPGPGGEGPAINPFSQPSLEAALASFDAMLARLPQKAIRAQFHDSYEYEGNWTEEIFTEFEARYGYTLAGYLPSLLGKGTGQKGERVRNDYRHLMGELFLEKVITPWVAKTHVRGQLARNQAHGSPGNLLDLYAASDIPETEVFGAEHSPRMAMFASSAAHVMGKRLVSSETATWITEHFTETLAEIKAEADMLFCAGINHIFYHGTAYSPADAPWPGWVFYAATEMNPQNSIWHDVPALNSYIAHCQAMLQSGRPDNDLLLYWPERDVWQGEATPLIRQLTVHKRAWFESEPFGQVAQELLERGYIPDYISDKQIALAKVEAGGELRLPGGRYKAILVPSCRTMPVDTLQNLKDLAAAGATVLFQNDLPADVPGWGHMVDRRTQFQAVQAALQPPDHAIPDQNDASLRGFHVGTGVVWIGSDLVRLMAKTPVRRERMVEAHGLAFARRADTDGTFYFVVNQGKEPINAWVPFSSLAPRALLMDPMSGPIGMAAIRTQAGSGKEVYLQLAPGESRIVRSFTPAKRAPALWKYWHTTAPKLPLTGNWQVEFIAGGPETPPPFQTTTLASWTKLGGERAERFAGTARYTLQFDLASELKAARLDLGAVCQSARLRLNGRNLGILFTAPFQFLAEDLKRTGNVLEVEVTGVAANRIRDLDRRGVNWKIFKDINFVNIDYQPFNAADWPLTDCGLLGPVTLQTLEPKILGRTK